MRRREIHGHHVFIGYDVAETRACAVAEYSLMRRASRSPVHVDRISLSTLGSIYTRPTTRIANGQLFDELSDAPMSTSHAIARFFIPALCAYTGWALFTDGDVLFRDDVDRLFELRDPQYAVQVVQHAPLLEEGTKKAGHIQQAYPRKNWSSVMLIHCGHLANRLLTTDVLNTWPGRDLHAFRWLRDDQIGALPARWNHLVHVEPDDPEAALVHYTLGTPDVEGHERDPFADEWFTAAQIADGYQRLAFHTEIG